MREKLMQKHDSIKEWLNKQSPLRHLVNMKSGTLETVL